MTTENNCVHVLRILLCSARAVMLLSEPPSKALLGIILTPPRILFRILSSRGTSEETRCVFLGRAYGFPRVSCSFPQFPAISRDFPAFSRNCPASFPQFPASFPQFPATSRGWGGAPPAPLKLSRRAPLPEKTTCVRAVLFPAGFPQFPAVSRGFPRRSVISRSFPRIPVASRGGHRRAPEGTGRHRRAPENI